MTNNIAGLDTMIRTQMGSNGEPDTYYAYVGTEGPVTKLHGPDVKRFSGHTLGDLLAQIIKAYA